MVRARDLLDRFRPVGAPGAAGTVGVPADRLAETTAELEPVFSLLTDVERECAALREEAAREAQRRRAQAGQRAEQVLATARTGAQAARAEEAGLARRRAEEASRLALDAATHEAEELRQRAHQRLPELVTLALKAVPQLEQDGPPP